MKIELKSIKLFLSMSEETPCYTAKVYADGVYIGDTENRGHGGPDNFRFCKAGATTERLVALNKQIAASYPGIDMKKYSVEGEPPREDIPADLELVCHRIVWDDHNTKATKRALAKKVVFTRSDKEGVWTSPIANLEIVRKSQTTAKVLNDLPLPEAVAIMHGVQE